MADPQLSINEMLPAAPVYQGEDHQDGCEPDEPQEKKEEKEEERKRRGSGQGGEESSNGMMNIDQGLFTRAYGSYIHTYKRVCIQSLYISIHAHTCTHTHTVT